MLRKTVNISMICVLCRNKEQTFLIPFNVSNLIVLYTSFIFQTWTSKNQKILSLHVDKI